MCTQKRDEEIDSTILFCCGCDCFVVASRTAKKGRKGRSLAARVVSTDQSEITEVGHGATLRLSGLSVALLLLAISLLATVSLLATISLLAAILLLLLLLLRLVCKGDEREKEGIRQQ